MEKVEVKKSTGRLVTKHTILAAFTTMDCYGVASKVTEDLKADLHELKQLEESALVDAAISLVNIAIKHSIKPVTATYDEARIARDELGELLINSKEIRG
ncbi:hypothetical protein MPH47_14010 [Psychrobacillus psychrodurans]|uniref:hypothetical protein n=1 Tax=Psychrobacillus psychrodurans TaxID=126157 RepID=UPI001F4EAB3F|nr:hypothetical protein [Psychrobacillus psychrodurans]MCK1998315.1 hypothetical protein [Psychrobacillus psychrodurans]